MRTPLLATAVVSALVALIALAAPEARASGHALSWTDVGTRKTVACATPSPNDKKALIVYGGYTADLDWVKTWTEALHDKKFRGFGYGIVCAVKGPDNAGYANQEIENTALAKHLFGTTGIGATKFAAVSHSSGGAVANEFYGIVARMLHVAPPSVYFALDSDTPAHAYWRNIEAVFTVGAAAKGIGESTHAGSMRAYKDRLRGTKGRPVEIDATRSGCNRGKNWCFHDAMIITRPHNPNFYDLRNDYQSFSSSNPLVTEWVDAASGVL